MRAGIYDVGRTRILGQSRTALTFIVVAALILSAVLVVLSPSTPEFFCLLGIRASAEELDIGDPGVSDYFPVYTHAGLAKNYIVSYVPGAEGSYELILDYLMFLNRSHGVNRVIVDIPADAAGLLNAYLSGGEAEPYFVSVAGSEYATNDFSNFITDIIKLNRGLTPGRKITFCGIGNGASGTPETADDETAEDETAEDEMTEDETAEDRRLSRYLEAAEDNGTLLLLSRYEAKTPGRLYERILHAADSGRNLGLMTTDIVYNGTACRDGAIRNDIALPLLDTGVYIASMHGLEWTARYYDFTVGATSSRSSGAEAGDLDGFVSEYFFIIVGGGEKPAATTGTAEATD